MFHVNFYYEGNAVQNIYYGISVDIAQTCHYYSFTHASLGTMTGMFFAVMALFFASPFIYRVRHFAP